MRDRQGAKFVAEDARIEDATRALKFLNSEKHKKIQSIGNLNGPHALLNQIEFDNQQKKLQKDMLSMNELSYTSLHPSPINYLSTVADSSSRHPSVSHRISAKQVLNNRQSQIELSLRRSEAEVPELVKVSKHKRSQPSPIKLYSKQDLNSMIN